MTPTDKLAKRLQLARSELKLSQFELGVKAGIEEATAKGRVSHYETGRRVPTLSTLQMMAVALNKPIAWFFCEDDELELLARLNKLSDADRQRHLAAITQNLPE